MSGAPPARSDGAMAFEKDCHGCGETFSVPLDRFQDKGFAYWLKATLLMQHTKESLEDFIERRSEEYYNSMKTSIEAARNCPSQCKIEDFQKENFQCQTKVCHELKQKLLGDSRPQRLSWHITPDITTVRQLLSSLSPTELAKLFLPEDCTSYSGPEKADCTAIFKLMYDCMVFSDKIHDDDLIKKVCNSRNEIVHSATLQLEDKDLTKYKEDCTNLLSDKRHLKYDTKCKQAIGRIEETRFHLDAELASAMFQKFLDKRQEAAVYILCQSPVIADVEDVESEALRNIEKDNKAKIERIKQSISSTKDPENLSKIKEEIKLLEEREAKRNVVMEYYGIELHYYNVSSLFGLARTHIEQSHERQLKTNEDQIEKMRKDIDKYKEDIIQDMNSHSMNAYFSGNDLVEEREEEQENAMEPDENTASMLLELYNLNQSYERQLKKKEDQITRMCKENGQYKHNILQNMKRHNLEAYFNGNNLVVEKLEGREEKRNVMESYGTEPTNFTVSSLFGLARTHVEQLHERQLKTNEDQIENMLKDIDKFKEDIIQDMKSHSMKAYFSGNDLVAETEEEQENAMEPDENTSSMLLELYNLNQSYERQLKKKEDQIKKMRKEIGKYKHDILQDMKSHNLKAYFNGNNLVVEKMNEKEAKRKFVKECYGTESVYRTGTVDYQAEFRNLFRSARSHIEQLHERQLKKKEYQATEMLKDHANDIQHVLQGLAMCGVKVYFDGNDFVVLEE